MARVSKLPTNIESHVMREVLGSYSHDEIREFKNFQEFWDQIDILNAHEEEWQEYKEAGVKSVYSKTYYQLKRGLE